MNFTLRRVLALSIGILGGVAIAMLTSDPVRHWTGYNRCEYRFPWSGQCVLNNGHHGEHC